MKLYILSDLHFELINPRISNDLFVPEGTDLTIVAGDYHTAHHVVRHIREQFSDGPLVLVAGNHEHYASRMTVADGIKQMRTDAKEDAKTRQRITHFLENESVELEIAGERVRFIGATLWTDFALFGNPEVHSNFAGSAMNDYSAILAYKRQLEPADTLRWNAESRRFLRGELMKPFEGKTIVITHHAPSQNSVSARYLRDPLTPAFASNCDDLLNLGADLWVHGHMHDSSDYLFGKTRVVCNPRGYSNRDGPQFGVENKSFIENLLIEI